ncbi:MAG: ribosome small subunit-dependent GTPase A [Chlamydiae bacterium]|nr:ribosome small subunit-dependent GTPase A [Chlamydiota bacterium]
MANHDQFEEEFFYQDRKRFRKERKILSRKDRSKYKKTDQNKVKPLAYKTREQHLVKEGRVLTMIPEAILVESEGKVFKCTIKGGLKKEVKKVKSLITVNDFVEFIPKNGQEGVITLIKERKSILSRADHLLRMKQQLIAANIDQVFITASVVLPPLKPHLIDRYIIAAKKGKMNPLIVINKTDLLKIPPKGMEKEKINQEQMLLQEVVKTYQNLHIPLFLVSTETKEGIDELKEAMKGKTSVFAGQSGTGKSSLINATTQANLLIGKIIEKTRKGTHTTSNAQLLPVEGGGMCIDTPGIRSFGIWDLSLSEIQSYFSEIANFAKKCKFPDCSHMKEPECAVKKAVEKNLISLLRFDSYCALMAELMEKEAF